MLGTPHFECHSCNTIIHAKCFKSSKAEVINHNLFCIDCKESIVRKYNPFKSMINCKEDDIDPYLQRMSDILENCESYSIKDFNKKAQTYSRDYCSMIFQNIDGNKTNFDEFSMVIERLSINFQVIGLAETNVGSDESPVYKLEGYTPYYQDKHVNKSRGTGIALYVEDSLNAVVNENLSWVTKNLETLFITIQHDQPIHIGVIYRPPSGNPAEAMAELQKILELCPKKNLNLLGDYNIDLHHDSDKYVNEFETMTSALSMMPVISVYTHEKPGCKKSCIDNILTNDIENSVCSGTIDTCISHHKAIFHIINSPVCDGRTPELKYMQYYDYCSSNVAKFTESLSYVLNTNPPKDFSEFHSVFTDQLDKACKLEQPKCSKRTVKNNPWITNGLITSINRKHELHDLWQIAKKNKCLLADKSSLTECLCYNCINKRARHEDFKKYRKKTNYLINCAKLKYNGEKLKECVGDSKKTWEIINNLRGKSRRQIKPNFVIDDERVTNRRIIANEFNKYFASIASKLNEAYVEDGLRISPLPSFTDYLPKPCLSSIYLLDCDHIEILEIISELKNGKSSDIPIHVIKASSYVIAPYLTTYFNNCMQEGYFPDELKTGRISPIYKKDNEELLENYRPVSTLPVFGKILEKLIYKRLYSFFISKGLINENQFGFRKNHSTSHALNYSVESIQSLLKNKQHVLGIFIDLSKAFDTLAHDKLTAKLENYGIRGNALKLIASYLSNRKQFVNVLNENSDELSVEYGVPQGSVLGPLLFIIYINDLCNITDKGKFVLFADDTNIFIAAESKNKAYSIANKVLQAVSTYMEVNLLHINVKKCCYMYFSPSKNHKDELNDDLENQYLSINCKIIQRVSQTKFLGIIIDDKLNWQPHLASLNKKLRSACGRIYRIKKCLPEYLHKQIYHSLFESHLSFAISVWGGVPSNQLKPLFITQKKCIRMIFGDNIGYLDKFNTSARVRPLESQRLGANFYKKESTKPLFSKHEVLAVENLYRLRTIIELFKIIKYRTPISLNSLFKISDRNDTRLVTPSPSTQFVYKSAYHWNEFRKVIGKLNFTSPCSSVKNVAKKSLLSSQNRYGVDWCDKNFSEF